MIWWLVGLSFLKYIWYLQYTHWLRNRDTFALFVAFFMLHSFIIRLSSFILWQPNRLFVYGLHVTRSLEAKKSSNFHNNLKLKYFLCKHGNAHLKNLYLCGVLELLSRLANIARHLFFTLYTKSFINRMNNSQQKHDKNKTQLLKGKKVHKF